MNKQMGNMLVNEVAPRLAATIPWSVKPLGAEDAEELIQDGTAIAAGILASCAKARKKVTAGNVAHYTLLLLKAGRRSTGSVRTDAMSPFTRMLGRADVVPLDEPVGHETTSKTESPLTLADVLADDREDPAGQALRSIDWDELRTNLPSLEAAALDALAEGRGLSATARRHRVSPSTMSTVKRRLAARIAEAWGEDAVAQSGWKPAWKADLHAAAERRASKWERQPG